MGKVYEKLVSSVRQGVLLEKLAHKVQFETKYMLMFFLKYYWGITTKVEKGKILFLTFQGTYTCNPKYICEELINRGYTGELVWVIDDEKERVVFPEQVRTVKRGTNQYYRDLYSANIWIDNAFNVTREPVWKRKNQIYIETMHGSLGIKRIDPKKVRNARRNKRGYDCGRLSDYIISNSVFEENVYKGSFWKNTELLPYGHARNDILFVKNGEIKQQIIQKVRSYFNIDDNQKVVLYAPTFRDYGEDGEKIDLCRLIQVLEQTLGGEWVVIERRHHRDKVRLYAERRKILDGDLYPDIQELMVATDVGITDYSSWIFDFLLLGKPGFLYVTDAERYRAERGFYYPLDKTPFPLAGNNQELEDAIKSFAQKAYEERVEQFLEEKGCYEKGTACERIVNKIVEIVEGYK